MCIRDRHHFERRFALLFVVVGRDAAAVVAYGDGIIFVDRHVDVGLDTDLTLDSVGAHKMRSQGEEHKYNPQTIHLLQESTWTGSYDLFKQLSLIHI